MSMQPRTLSHPVPVDYARPGGATFDYTFKYFPSTKADASTVIVLNGGPGATLLNLSPDDIAGAAPVGAITTSQLNVIYTDQRGSGANTSPLLTDDAFRTEYIARDVLSIVKRLGLKSYLLYGASFGTVQATHVASLAAALSLPAPKAVVLEGTFGKATKSFADYFTGSQREWELVKQQLPASIVAALSTTPLPLGHTAETWGTFIQLELLKGTIAGSNVLASHLAHLADPDDSAGKSTLKGWLDLIAAGLADPKTPGLRERMSEVIMARELFGGTGVAALVDGKLTLTGRDPTQGQFPYEPYDSAKLPVRTPLYYFQGTNDPATPAGGARYHFDNQRAAHRTMLTVPGAGHGPLTWNLRALNTSPLFWDAIDRRDGGAFAAAVNATGLEPSQLTVAEPETSDV